MTSSPICSQLDNSWETGLGTKMVLDSFASLEQSRFTGNRSQTHWFSFSLYFIMLPDFLLYAPLTLWRRYQTPKGCHKASLFDALGMRSGRTDWSIIQVHGLAIYIIRRVLAVHVFRLRKSSTSLKKLKAVNSYWNSACEMCKMKEKW